MSIGSLSLRKIIYVPWIAIPAIMKNKIKKEDADEECNCTDLYKPHMLHCHRKLQPDVELHLIWYHLQIKYIQPLDHFEKMPLFLMTRPEIVDNEISAIFLWQMYWLTT